MHEAQVFDRGPIPSVGLSQRFLRLCYVKRHNILLWTVRDSESDKNYEILAEKLGSESNESETIVWSLFGSVDGRLIKPGCIACDPEGNTYVSDKATNRILKINSLTGKILEILVVDEEENERISSIRWTNAEPTLTFRQKDQITTYFIQK